MGPQPGDEELMLRVKGGSEEAFTLLFDRHKEGLLGFCFSLLRNWEDAADVLQDAFRYVHGHAATYQPTARFTTYLYHIARNMSIDILRRRRRHAEQPLSTEIDLPDPAPLETSRLEHDEVEANIKKALEEVPDPYREVLRLRVVQDLPYEEIARILECPIGTVKSRLHAGLDLLRRALKRKRIVE